VKGEVGVDVETIRVVEGADRIAAGSFSRREHETYCALPPAARPLGFLACWTRKEAFVKALGAGLGHPLDSFDVSLAPHEPARILRVEHRSGENCGWQLRAFNPVPGFIAAVVSEAPS
jgi:4'-phosphopantetheinyl transferase